MEKTNEYKNISLTLKKIRKIWIPIILTIFIALNIPFIPNHIVFNNELNLQPSSATGEEFFFPSSFFSNNQNSSNNHNDMGTALWVLFLVGFIVIGIIYIIKIKPNFFNKEKIEDKIDYIELLKDESDYERNI